MKIKYMVFSIVSVFLITCLFSGCSINSVIFDVENLITPPSGNTELNNIKSVVYDTVGNYELAYPNDGDYRNAITLKDLNGDNIEEAIVLFKQSDDYLTKTDIMVLSKIDGVWQSSGQFSVQLPAVQKLDFANIDGDDTKEIVIAFSNKKQTTNNINILSLKDGLTPVTQNLHFAYFDTHDYDDDSTDEVMLLSSIRANEETYAKLLKYNTVSYSMDTIGRLSLSDIISEWANVQFGTVFKGQNGLAVDELLDNGKYATDVIYWDRQSSMLKAPLFSSSIHNGKGNTATNTLHRETIRYTPVFCSDKNNDQILDIPVEYFSVKQTNAIQNNTNKECPLIIWSTLDNEGYSLKAVKNTVVNTANGYCFSIPDEWIGKTAYQMNTSDKTLTVSYLSKTENGSYRYGDAILKIKLFSVYAWDNSLENSSEFKEILKTDAEIYAINILKNNGDFIVTEEELKDNFILL